MGEHGVFRVNLKDVGGLLQLEGTGVTHGPWFGDNSPYFDHGVVNGRRLYGTVRYYHPHDSTNPTDEVFSHNPYFLDVAVENLGAGRHRLYAAVDHLGWCAFNLDAPWDTDIWTAPATPPVAAPGYPDFIQEGKRYPIGSQANDQIRLLDEPELDADPGPPEVFDRRQTYSRHLEVVTTQRDAQAEPTSSLVVTVVRSRFVHGPGRMNDGRALKWNLNVGPIEIADYPALSFGGANDVLAYDLEHVGDSTPSQVPPNDPLWVYDGQNFLGRSVGGWDLCVPEVQPYGGLHFFYGTSVGMDKQDEPGSDEMSMNLTRVWYSAWPDTILVDPPSSGMGAHDDYLTRNRFWRLGRQPLSFGPSKLDPNILVIGTNDAGVAPDGPLVFDPLAKTIAAPFAAQGFQLSPYPPVSVGSGKPMSNGQGIELSYGIVMDPRGGFVNPAGTHEYRMGFNFRYIGGPLGGLQFASRWLANKWHATYNASNEVDTITTDMQLWFTPPSSKFSPWPMATNLENRAIWSGRPYYSTTATFEDYNAYVAGLWAQGIQVDPDGLLFSGNNGSPQGLWVIAKSVMQDKLDGTTVSFPFDDLLEPDNNYGNAPFQRNLIRGALVTHPEFWNVDDVRKAGAHVDAAYFLKKTSSANYANVKSWTSDMLRLPLPATAPEDFPWVLAVPCGHIALSPNDAIFDPTTANPAGHPEWRPHQRFQDGYEHMLVRLFDLTNPLLIRDVVPQGALDPNQDSRAIPAFTLIGPDPNTSAHFTKGVQVEDSLGVDRYLLLVGDLSGKLYLYDIGNLLALNTGTPPSDPTSTNPLNNHYGWFFDDPPLATYTTQESLSDAQPNGIYGCEVVNEVWNNGADKATYVYLGVPRIGVEVAKLTFDGSNQAQLDYIGRIQTPGNATNLYVEQFGPNPPPGYPASLLYVADYDGGIRIYAHPTGGI
jgi:hypothetical protein